MQTIISSWELVSRSAKGLGPYLMLEILMPGGTLLCISFSSSISATGVLIQMFYCHRKANPA